MAGSTGNSANSCLIQAASFAPSLAAMYSASVIDSGTVSCLREYHRTGWSANVIIMPVWDLAPSPPYNASACILALNSSSSPVTLNRKPSDFVDNKYRHMSLAVCKLVLLGNVVCHPNRFTWMDISGRVIRARYSSPPTTLWKVFWSHLSSPSIYDTESIGREFLTPVTPWAIARFSINVVWVSTS